MPLSSVHSTRSKTVKIRKSKYLKNKYSQRGTSYRILVGNRIEKASTDPNARRMLYESSYAKKLYKYPIFKQRTLDRKRPYNYTRKPRIESFKIKIPSPSLVICSSNNLMYTKGIHDSYPASIPILSIDIRSPGPIFSKLMLTAFSFHLNLKTAPQDNVLPYFGLFAVIQYSGDKKPYAWPQLVGSVNPETGMLQLGNTDSLVFKKNYFPKSGQRPKSKPFVLARSMDGSYGRLSLHITPYSRTQLLASPVTPTKPQYTSSYDIQQTVLHKRKSDSMDLSSSQSSTLNNINNLNSLNNLNNPANLNTPPGGLKKSQRRKVSRTEYIQDRERESDLRGLPTLQKGGDAVFNAEGVVRYSISLSTYG